MRKLVFAQNEIYHIYNRGVEKRDVFLDDNDRLRFIHNLYEFNDSQPAVPSNIKYASRNPGKEASQMHLKRCLEAQLLNRKRVVDILAFCLMPNHFHLLIQQKEEKGIVRFMQKLGTGYTNYFNQKYQRVGSLFQGRFKAVLVERDAHFLYLPHYIHCNPLDLATPDWRNGKTTGAQDSMTFLESYRWSSFPDYIGKNNFPSVTERALLIESMGGHDQYKQNTALWLNNAAEKMEMIKNTALDLV